MPGNLGLDFANTAEWVGAPDLSGRSTSYGRAVAWAREHDILSEEQAAAVLEQAAADPERTTQALARVMDMRQATYRVLAAAARQQAPAERDLQEVAVAARDAAAHLKLIAVPPGNEEARDLPPEQTAAGGPRASGHGPRFAWVWCGLDDELAGFLWPVAKAVAELLTSSQLAQLRQCADDQCGWLFLDLSKNASRRWCDMAECGNRAKARRYRERKKGTALEPGQQSAAEAAGR